MPSVVALGAHSSIMNCQPSGFKEFRLPIWEPLFTFPNVDAAFGIDTQRTGLPTRYYTDWDDYWQDVAHKLFLTNDINRAFESNMKQFWRTVRLKPCPGSVRDCLLEIRALSTQPTLEEDAAFYMLLCGLLHDPDWLSRPLLPMEQVSQNFDAASKHGLATQLYTHDAGGAVVLQPAATVAAELIDEASRIWRSTSLEAADLVELLRQRLRPREESPAQSSLHLYEQAVQAGQTQEEAAHRVLMAYVVNGQA
jgi:gamma-glutamylcysteine synthetase